VGLVGEREEAHASPPFCQNGGVQAYSTAHLSLDLPEGHPFPLYKYRGVAEALKGLVPILPAPEVPREALFLAHEASYLEKLFREGLSRQESLRLGLPFSPGLLKRALHAAGGTLMAAEDALRTGLGLNLAGGTHHAFPDRAEGYSLFNDVAVAVRWLRARGFWGRVLVVDLDAHQGNGTAFFFRDDPTVYTLSLHGERNYPLKKEKGDLDVGLPDGVGDEAYLKALDEALEKAEAFRPHLVFYNAGVDVLKGDRFGRLALSPEGVKRRDARVFRLVRALGVPLVVVMGGGYNRDPRLTVEAHAATYRLALSSLA
jgi:Deacetylases, including yeast histone deacetylase and acetoin utilization protein